MAKIPEQTIEQIAAANDIVEVIGSYFPLKRAGSSFRALCPFHQERTPSFHVNPSRQSFHCFGCGAGGSVFRFVMNYENIDFPTAARRLAERAGIKIIEEEASPEDDRRFRMRKRLLALHLDAADWFHRNLLKTEGADAARAYLKERGLSAEVARAWKLGYAPDSWDALGIWARGQGYSAEELVMSGLVSVKNADDLDLRSPQAPVASLRFYDRFRDRVMFPICNDLGEVVAFSGRVLAGDAQGAKYVNSPETLLFTKGNILFGLHKSKRALVDKGSAIVCEGQLDLITAFEAGVQNVVAPQGTAFTEKQARTLKRFVEEVVLCFDSDSAGAKATERSLTALLGADLTVRVAAMPAGHDPDSLIRSEGAEAFAERIKNARDFFDFQIERHAATPEFATPRGKVQFARKMAEFVALMTDRVLREAVANKIAARLEIPLREFWAMLAAKPASNLPAAASGEAVKPRQPIKRLALNSPLGTLELAALRDAAARAWIAEQPWQKTLSRIEGSDLLLRILGADFRPDDPHSVAAFTAQLSPEEENAISALLEQKVPENAAAISQEAWRQLQRRELERRRDALALQMNAPNLTPGEIWSLHNQRAELQKQILDLQKPLPDIARPFPRPAD